MKKLVLFAIAAVALTAETRTLSFDDCYRVALTNNDDHRIARLDVEIAEAQFQKATADFGPTVTASGGYLASTRGALVTIPMMGSFEMSTRQPYTAQMSVNQPLFTFGRLSLELKIQEEQLRIAKVKLKKAGEKLKADTISAFYGALVSQESHRIQEESLKRAKEMLAVNQRKFAGGEASSYDVLRSRIEVDSTAPNVKSMKNAYEMSLKRLKAFIGMELSAPIALAGELSFRKIEIDYPEVEKRFRISNDDREIQERLSTISECRRWKAVSQLFPTISISANNVYSLSNYNFRWENWQNSWDISIGFQWTLYNNFKNVSDIKQASADAEKQRITQQSIEKQFRLQLESIYLSLDEYKDIIEAADRTVKQAEEGYRIARENFVNGLAKNIDLRDAEVALMRSKLNYLNALYNYIVKAEEFRNLADIPDAETKAEH
ncbi:MAG: TolC family protein [Spirochaetota bacterium]